MNRPAISPRTLRTTVAALLALDLVVLLAFSVRRQTVAITTTRAVPAVTALAGPSPVAPATPAPTQPPALGLPGAGPIPVDLPEVPSPTAPPPGRPTSGPSASPTPTPTKSAEAVAAKCPIKISKETPPDGGLQSLIDFAPAFGELSAEAFAAASAYQPVLRLLGPILAQYPALAPELAPLVTPFVSAAQRASDSVFAVLGPLYSPYRQQVLKSETKLAAALAPYAEKLADSALGGCVVQLEAALVKDATRSGS